MIVQISRPAGYIPERLGDISLLSETGHGRVHATSLTIAAAVGRAVALAAGVESVVVCPRRLVRRDRLQRILFQREDVFGHDSVSPLAGRRLTVELFVR